MSLDFDAMIENRTWDLVDRKHDDNIINNIWLFKVKENVNDSVKKLKARLVANGVNRIEGL